MKTLLSRLLIVGITVLTLLPGCADTADPGAACSDCGDATVASDRSRRSPTDDATTSTDSVTGDAGTEDASTDQAAVGDAELDFSGDAVEGTDPGRGGSIRPEPESILFGATGATQEQVIRIYNETDQIVTFTSATVESAASGFSLVQAPVNVVREPGGVVGFKLLYNPASSANADANIIVNHTFGEAVVIPVTVADKVEENGCVSVSPTSINFGTVARGSAPVSRPVTITNCGEAQINILRLDRGRVFFLPTPDSFQWTSDPLPIVLDAGESTGVIVTFTAGRAGPQGGAMEVVSNVTGSERTTVRLSAVSEPPPIADLDVHLILNWDVEGGSDVDFHFYPESSTLFSCDDCFYSNMSPDWGTAGDIIDDPFLDYDDLEGPGPENINVDELQPGTYIIAVHYYSDTGSGGDGEDSSFPESANATVEVYLGGTLRQTYGPVFLGGTDDTWNVAKLDWPSETLTELGDVFNVNRSDYSWCSGF